MTGYSVKVAESSKELSAKERITIKDTTDCIKLDEATQNGAAVIDVDYYAILDIHNDKAEDKDYQNIVIADKDGNKYSTGSTSFITSFVDIYDEMRGEVDTQWAVKCYRVPSKNYKGKEFLTCSIV